MADLLAQEPDRNNRHYERRDPTRERINVAEIPDPISPVKEQHVAGTQYRTRTQIRPAFSGRNRNEREQAYRDGELRREHHLDESEPVLIRLDKGIPDGMHESSTEDHQE